MVLTGSIVFTASLSDGFAKGALAVATGAGAVEVDVNLGFLEAEGIGPLLKDMLPTDSTGGLM